MDNYFATIYSLHGESAARARSPDWSVPGQTPKTSVGPNAFAFECGTCADQEVIPKSAQCGRGGATGCPKIGNFSGIAVVNGVGPYAFQRLYHDDSNRFTAALAATPMKQYYEYSMDPVFLAECYTWVRDTAEFYRSFVVRNTNTGKFDIPWACGEEGCVLRNSAGTPGKTGACPKSVQERQARNPMTDLALARMALRMAADYATQLKRDPELIGKWLEVADELADYPTILDPLTGSEVFAESIDADRNTSVAFGCNLEEPMLYLTAVFPAEQISRRRHGNPPTAEEQRLWTIANDTLFGIGEYTRRWAMNGLWAPLNGLCQLWPPVARLIGRESSAAMLDIFTATLERVMYPNFYPHLGGGGLEQAGAVGVINEMMLTADVRDRYLEFFALWPHGEAAAFESLRAKGAFVCSGSVGADGLVSDIRVVSERGGNLSFVPPGPARPGTEPRVTGPAGVPVPAESLGGGVWRVQTEVGAEYTIHAAAGS